MNKKKIIILMLGIFFAFPSVALAHPGRLDSNGGHYCHKNCEKWGLDYEEYHYHSGNTYRNKKGQVYNHDGTLIKDVETPSNSNNNNNVNNNYQPVVKSSDNTLKSVIIDGTSISVSPNMTYETNNNNPNILANANHYKAKVSINKPSSYKLSETNEVTIIVTAENGSMKEYKLLIKILDSDTSLKEVLIDNEKVDILDIMDFKTTKENIKVTAIPTSNKAKVEITNSDKLKIGLNEIIIKVVSEDENITKEYKINIERSKILSNNTNLTMHVNDELVTFNNFKSDTVYINNNVEKIKITYNLEDEASSIDLKYDENIKVGNNTIKFVVTAENGEKQEYTLIVHRYSKIEDTVYIILGLGVLGRITFGIVKGIKFTKRKTF